jgi:hypothetical protein
MEVNWSMCVKSGVESTLKLQCFTALNSDTTAAKTCFVINFINSLQIVDERYEEISRPMFPNLLK